MDDDSGREERRDSPVFFFLFFSIFWIPSFPLSSFPFTAISFRTQRILNLHFSLMKTILVPGCCPRFCLILSPFPVASMVNYQILTSVLILALTCDVFFLSVDNFVCFVFVLNSLSLSLSLKLLSFSLLWLTSHSRSFLYLPLSCSLDPQVHNVCCLTFYFYFL